MDYTQFGIDPLSDGGGGGYAEPLPEPSMDWGASSPLSGMGGLFGGGGGLFDFGGGMQDDSLITTTAMNAGSPVDGPVPQAQEEPSFFKKLFSGAIIGLGMGGGGDDFASGFSKGYQGVMQMREMERQRKQQEEEFKMKQQMQQAQIAQMDLQNFSLRKQNQYMDQDHQMAVDKANQQKVSDWYSRYGGAEEVSDAMPTNLAELKKKYGQDMLIEEAGGKFYVFDPNKTLEQDTTISDPRTGNQITLHANQNGILDEQKWWLEQDKMYNDNKMKQQENASQERIAKINASRPYASMMQQPGSVPENAQYQIRAIENDISRFNGDLNKAQEDFPGLTQDANGQWMPPQGQESNRMAVAAASAANQAQSAINQKTQERDQLIQSFNRGGGQQGGQSSFSSRTRLAPAQAKQQGYTQEKFNSQTGQWEYR